MLEANINLKIEFGICSSRVNKSSRHLNLKSWKEQLILVVDFIAIFLWIFPSKSHSNKNSCNICTDTFQIAFHRYQIFMNLLQAQLTEIMYSNLLKINFDVLPNIQFAVLHSVFSLNVKFQNMLICKSFNCSVLCDEVASTIAIKLTFTHCDYFKFSRLFYRYICIFRVAS